jgi:hypothetical protein
LSRKTKIYHPSGTGQGGGSLCRAGFLAVFKIGGGYFGGAYNIGGVHVRPYAAAELNDDQPAGDEDFYRITDLRGGCRFSFPRFRLLSSPW